MPPKVLSPASPQDLPLGSRVAIYGPPNSLKTTATLTWPTEYKDPTTGEEYQGMVHVSYPGEKGWETVPRDHPQIVPIVWQIEDPEKISPSQIVREVEQTTWLALAGKFTPKKPATFVGDGFHKLYDWYYKRALADKLAFFSSRKDWDGDEEKCRWPAYAQAHDDFGLYLTRLLQSPIPFIVGTLWEDRVKDNPDDTSMRAPRHVFPDLPQKMAKRIVGEFPVVLYSKTELPDLKGNIRGYWQARAAGDIWGVGIKCPPEIAMKIPNKLPMNFQALQKAMRGELTNA